MRQHVQYLRYVLRHKWFVYVEGRRLGVPVLQLLAHDWTKFLPDEWLPYARYFYGEDVGALESEAFDHAWLAHQRRSPHHWQFWVLHEDSGRTKVLKMPERYALEMLADWRGAGRAIHGKDETAKWYAATKAGRRLHRETQAWVETQLGVAS